MSSSPGPWPFVAVVVLVVGPWAVIILAVAAFDLDYVIGTARALQDLLVLGVSSLVWFGMGAGVVALAAGAMGVRFLWHRSAGDVVRSQLAWRGQAQLAAAQNSAFPALTTYSPRYDSRTEVVAPALAPAPAIEATAPPAATVAPAQLLDQLRAQGQIGVGCNRLMLGIQGGAGVPVEIGVASMIAIGGSPRMGKSTLAVWLISQAALGGWPVFLCDPHGHDPQSILSRIEPIGHLLARRATTPHEMAEAVAAFDALGRARLHGGDADRTPALLVIDELPALALSGQLPPATMETLIRIGSQYPKVHLLMAGIGYDWSASLFNSPYAAPLRRLALPRAVVNADPASAKHLVGEQLAKQARDLTRGQALYLGYGSYGLIDVPQVTRDDLTRLAGSCPQPPAPPPVVLDVPALEASAPTIELPLSERILAQLRRGPQTSSEISEALGADLKEVCARLTELADDGEVSRSGSRRAYRYALPQGEIAGSGPISPLV